ncbi:MAG TPA: ATP-dependent DNA ligase [Candidatus Altiarchaeales archaeon]|nr:ATP-dependent DNA ligase [Candidatus Altiarchaeales archaeon]HEX54517.1 ATP-dependent DNA ligase [Candidatus Altiarchaeales archaeon]
MDFSTLVEIYEKLEKTTSRLEMTSIVSEFLSTVPDDKLPVILLFLMGRVFPIWSDKELGVGSKLVIKAISNVSGIPEFRIEDKIRETGDTGLAAESLLVKKVQTTLFQEKLTVEKVHHNLEKLASVEGKGAQDKKISYITELLSFAEPVEAKYIIRLILEELRLGVGEGIVRDAIARAFNVDAKLVERAYSLISDIGEVARIAKNEGNEGLKKAKIIPGRPIEVMLAQKVENVSEALKKLGIAAFEIKYDGARLQIHKYNNVVELFTRRLENVTRQFPEVVKYAEENIKANSAIVEGEMVAIISKENRHPRPFQDLSKRIKRKYNIEEMIEKIPVEVNLFDIVYYNGKQLIDEKFNERRKILRKIINETNLFRLSDQLVTDDVKKAEEFYERALDLGHEGVMAKNLDAPYQPGSRVGYMYKIKPIMETLDLVIVGATWGEGRRAHWLGSYLLAVRDPDTGDFLTIGRMATGFTDDQLKEMTSILKPLITEQIGKEVKLKPKIVVEVGYEEIQRSPTYESGYALRFPRLIRIRDDKQVKDADTLQRIEEILRGS